MEIVPERTTHYTILAEGFDGNVVTRVLTLVVAPVPARRRERVNLISLPGGTAGATRGRV
jgi:hypothetical protein